MNTQGNKTRLGAAKTPWAWALSALLLISPVALAQDEKAPAAGKEKKLEAKDLRDEPSDPSKKTTVDPTRVLEKARDEAGTAAKREAEFKQSTEDFLKAVEQLPRGAVDIKTESIVWEKLDVLIAALIHDVKEIVQKYPRFKSDHSLMMSAFDSAITGCLEAVKVCEADAKTQKDDQTRQDYADLALLTRKAAERLRQRAGQAGLVKTEVDRMVQQAEVDIAYLTRLQQVVKLISGPLEKEKTADQFVNRMRRYFEQREQLRKMLRNLSDKLDGYPTPAPGTIKTSSDGNSPLPQASPAPSGHVVEVLPTKSAQWNLVLVRLDKATAASGRVAVQDKHGTPRGTMVVSFLSEHLAYGLCPTGSVRMGDVAQGTSDNSLDVQTAVAWER